MAHINHLGNVIARCPGCKGALATFIQANPAESRPTLRRDAAHSAIGTLGYQYQCFLLLRCTVCGRGAFAEVFFTGETYPGSSRALLNFFPEAPDVMRLPDKVPGDIQYEFREAESCMAAGCLRAAAGLFRSVLEKTLRANGYVNGSLSDRISQLRDDALITQSRCRRAHEEVRVLGNNVLHDEWRKIPLEDVEAARHYCQRVLEDLYSDREQVENTLKEKDRKFRLPEPEPTPEPDTVPPAGERAAPLFKRKG